MRDQRMACALPCVNLENLSSDLWKMMGLLYHRNNSDPRDSIPFDDANLQSV